MVLASVRRSGLCRGVAEGWMDEAHSFGIDDIKTSIRLDG